MTVTIDTLNSTEPQPEPQTESKGGWVSSARRRPEPLADHPLGVVDQMLKDREMFLEQIESSSDGMRIARVMLVTILVGCAAFGAAMGAFRPGWQILSAGVKLPLVLLFTAGLCAPALTALLKAYGHKTSLQEDLILVLTSLARTSLVLAALAPVLLLAVLFDAAYHEVVMMVVGICGVGGAVGLSFFTAGLRRRGGPGMRMAVGVALVLFMTVAAQMTWTMRPFVSRPRADFAWIRAQEGRFVDAVMTSADSARGVYHRSEAPLPSEEH